MGLTSHPAWVCGLKLYKEIIINSPYQSHPAWVCGLKPCKCIVIFNGINVTPCVGVWIETLQGNYNKLPLSVTPCVGVWIETTTAVALRPFRWSHPAWVCGLKLFPMATAYSLTWSHPAWVCGLKQRVQGYPAEEKRVTPCVGVWIET